MNIIDFRSRPPFSSIVESTTFNVEAREATAPKWGMGIDDSTRKRSMALFMKESDDLHIDKIVVPIRKLYNHQNIDLLKLVDQYPDRIVAVPCIDPLSNLEEAFREIEQLVINGPCWGIVMEPGYACVSADDKRLFPIYEKCQSANIPVFLSFGGLCHEDLDSLQPVAIDHVAKNFPDLTLILNHGGWPYVNEMCWIAFKRKNVYLVPDLYVLNAPGSQDYIAAANYLIPNKIIFGSAYPVVSTKDAIRYYENCGLRPEVLEKVMYQNAASLLKI